MGKVQPNNIIWSADVPSWSDILDVMKAKALPPGTIIKLDRRFFEAVELANSKAAIDVCGDYGYPVFCDVKIIEIPSKCLEIAEAYLKHNPFMVNFMAAACSTGCFNPKEDENSKDALLRFAKLCEKYDAESCVVTVLTSKTPKICEYEYGVNNPVDQVMKYVDLACQAGITNIVCSPLEAAAIRKHHEYDHMMINTPGVRLPDSAKDDQARVWTPHAALTAGADRLVIGRPLTGTDEQGPLAERIQRNYDAILKNIEFGP